MKISTRGRYALEAVLDLALNAGSDHESLKNISERQKLSENYLEQLFIELRRKKIVESIRGAQGGYRLAREPGDIKAGEVIRALEGTLAPVPCIDSSARENNCTRFDSCVTRVLWQRIADEINKVADSVTLADLAECIYEYENTSRNKHYNNDNIEYFI